VNNLIRELKNEDATKALGRELSLFASCGMVICLSGDLGAGKTTLARALIQALSINQKPLEIPSPTFSLVQSYEALRINVYHFDLYRINNSDEVYELGLFDDLEDRLTIIEWPDRIETDQLKDRLEICIETINEYRTATLKGFGTMEKLVERMNAITSFLDHGPWKNADRQFLQGDASARRYERLSLPNKDNVILMDMPDKADGPVINAGKPYSQIAHIAEGIIPVAAINKTLHQLGFCTPLSLQEDLPNGLMIIEDFGDQVFGAMLNESIDMNEPVMAATQLLAHMTTIEWSDMAISGNFKHQVQAYGDDAMAIECSLLLDWFWPLLKNGKASQEVRDSFFNIWKNLFPLANTSAPVWVLRDFHSPNLIWLPERKDIDRVGLIDTQDCLLGHPAYDLVSMLQDARVDLPDEFEVRFFRHYTQLRQELDPGFDEKSFAAAYAMLGAQRATKILGIFARLAKRDGKPGYLKNIPRVSAALEHNLSHPALWELAQWYQTYLPVEERSLDHPLGSAV